MTAANPPLTVFLHWNPGLKFKIFRDNNFIPDVCPHICSSEIHCKPSQVSKEEQCSRLQTELQFQVCLAVRYTTATWCLLRQEGLLKYTLVAMAGKVGECSCVWHILW